MVTLRAMCNRSHITFAVALTLLAPMYADADGGEAVGAAIYHQGILPSGEPLRATVQGDVPMEGRRAACVNCHGRSGMGLVEGGKVARPVTGELLFRPRDSRWRRRLPEDPGRLTTRPAYTEDTLSHALRTGLDPAGRAFDPLMPRYTLGDRELKALRAYLETLSATPSPGVDGETLHLATVITPDADPVARSTALGVLKAFFDTRQAQTRNEHYRASHSPWTHHWQYTAYRDWRLHAWELQGPAEGWGDQLDRLYGERPVFAIVGGVGGAEWAPVHRFCERQSVPCILPIATPPAEGGHWSVYFSRGLDLEAAVLADHLQRSSSDPGVVLQIYRKGSPGERAAAALRALFDADDGHSLIDWELETDGAIPSRVLTGERRIVLWLDGEELAARMPSVASDGADCRIYLSATITGSPHRPLPDALAGSACLVHPYAIGDDYRGRVGRAAAWLTARGMEEADPRIAADTLFAATLTGHALRHLRSLYHREYLVERIEHLTDSAIPAYSYPQLTLGTGQRIASRGGYIVRLSASGPLPVSGWIVPDEELRADPE